MKNTNMQQGVCLVWIDLEMTGLDASRDVILEIATVITDVQLNVIAQGPNIVIFQQEKILAVMDQKVRDLHAPSGLLDRVATSTVSVADAQDQICAFIKQYTAGSRALLAGNSIWNDRTFLQRFMPRILELLHYRMVDVSTIKELILNWYPEKSEFKKQKKHRALDDIQESIAELRYYKEHFFV